VLCGSLGHSSIFGQVGNGGLSLLVNFCEPNCLIIKCHSSLWRLPNWQRPQKGVKIADCHHLAHAHLPPHRPFENWPKRVGICGKYTYEHIYTYIYLRVFGVGFTRCQNSWCLADYVSWRCSDAVVAIAVAIMQRWKIVTNFSLDVFPFSEFFLLRVSKRFSFELRIVFVCLRFI